MKREWIATGFLLAVVLPAAARKKEGERIGSPMCRGQWWCVPTSNDAKKESLRRAQEDFPTPFVKGASFPPLTNNPTRRKRGDVRRMCQFLVG
jgi:hypothetical protein